MFGGYFKLERAGTNSQHVKTAKGSRVHSCYYNDNTYPMLILISGQFITGNDGCQAREGGIATTFVRRWR